MWFVSFKSSFWELKLPRSCLFCLIPISTALTDYTTYLFHLFLKLIIKLNKKIILIIPNNNNDHDWQRNGRTHFFINVWLKIKSRITRTCWHIILYYSRGLMLMSWIIKIMTCFMLIKINDLIKKENGLSEWNISNFERLPHAPIATRHLMYGSFCRLHHRIWNKFRYFLKYF